LRDLASHIEVLIEGMAETSGFIAEITDVTTEAVNETLTPGGMFALDGHKIKIAGDHADCGVYFVNAASPAQRIQVTGGIWRTTRQAALWASFRRSRRARGRWKW
jgi:hypothetical protein